MYLLKGAKNHILIFYKFLSLDEIKKKKKILLRDASGQTSLARSSFVRVCVLIISFKLKQTSLTSSHIWDHLTGLYLADHLTPLPQAK